jgi:hypothetical protein
MSITKETAEAFLKEFYDARDKAYLRQMDPEEFWVSRHSAQHAKILCTFTPKKPQPPLFRIIISPMTLSRFDPLETLWIVTLSSRWERTKM